MSSRFILVVLIVAGVLLAPFSFAQVIQDDRREELKRQMGELQSEINKYRGEIKTKQKEEKTLGREISILNSQIKKIELELQQTALALRQTELVIESNNRKIIEFEEKISRSKSIISEVLRSMYEEDSRGILELIVSSGDLSDFFEYSRFLESLQVSLYQALENLKVAKNNTQQEQQVLEEE